MVVLTHIYINFCNWNFYWTIIFSKSSREEVKNDFWFICDIYWIDYCVNRVYLGLSLIKSPSGRIKKSAYILNNKPIRGMIIIKKIQKVLFFNKV